MAPPNNKFIRCPRCPKKGMLNKIQDQERWACNRCGLRFGPEDMRYVIEASVAVDQQEQVAYEERKSRKPATPLSDWKKRRLDEYLTDE